MFGKKTMFKPGIPQKRKKQKIAFSKKADKDKERSDLESLCSKVEDSKLEDLRLKMKKTEVLMENARNDYDEKKIKLDKVKLAAQALIKAGKPGESYNTYCSTIIICEKDCNESLYKLNSVNYDLSRLHYQILTNE